MKATLFTGLMVLSLWLSAQSVQDGKTLINYDRYGSATTTLHQVIQKEPLNAEAWYWLAQAYINQDKSALVLDSFNKANADIQNNPAFKVAKGQLLLAEGKLSEAQVLFDEALKATKEKDAFILSSVARAHIDSRNGNYTYAVELLEKAIKREKKNAEHNILLGNAYRKLNNGSASFSAYREALNKDNQSAEANYQLGLIFLTQKNADMYLDYFNKALAADPNFAPALYQLYNHYFYVDAARAMDYFNQYLSKTDATLATDYAYTDLLYLNKQYDAAIANANKLLKNENKEPRLYKMLAYSYAEKHDSATALNYMQQYFGTEADSNLVMKDFETMANFYTNIPSKEDSAFIFLERAVALEKDENARYSYYKKLSNLAQTLKNYEQQGKWLGMYYQNNSKATNVDMFNWGLAYFRSGNFQMADSVFGMYVAKYPEQGFGYYWQARSNAARDKEMVEGLAIPHYKKLVEVIGTDTADENNKKWLIEAYAYMAAYETNTEKDYTEAVDYFEKLLEVDPTNEDAKKYITVLEKRIQDSDGK
jgi:tetratricopeptide (TPR) repeat protein